jgi:acyl dehydratase
MSLLTDEVRAWIGREVSRSSIRAFADALRDDDPRYRDADFARAHGFADVIAPPTFVCETNQFVNLPPDENGYAGHLWELPVKGCRLIRGGNAYEFDRPLLPSDRVTVRWTLESIEERTSSAGARMLVVTSVATYTDADGARIARNAETLIYQELA